PAGLDERADQLLELRLGRVELVQLVQDLLALLLLLGGGAGQPLSVGDVLPHGGPEVHFLHGLVLGFLDDQLLDHLLAQHQVVVVGPRGRGRPRLQLAEHPLDLFVVAAQHIDRARHCSSGMRWYPSWRPSAGEVIVSTLVSGISSGTERLVYRGEVPEDLALDDTIGALGGAFRYPFPYGYACVGVVEGWNRPVFAFQPHQDVFAAPAGDLIPLPAVDPAAATLFPLVETALQVTLDAGTGYRDRVIVLGAGVLGLLT